MNQEIDNRWIVPYKKLLLQSMNCHCNVALCMSIKSIKYVLKYVHKGCDQAMFALRSSQVDEILDYQNARYVSSNEAAWRILEFPIHERDPPVQQLAVHLEMVSKSTLLKTIHWIVLQGIHPRLRLQSFLHCAVWITLPRLCCMWMSPSTILGTTSLGADGSKAQMWQPLQASKKHTF